MCLLDATGHVNGSRSIADDRARPECCRAPPKVDEYLEYIDGGSTLWCPLSYSYQVDSAD
jgi:hypothetical protein